MRPESPLMLPNQRRVWWPYLLLLAILFVLSVSVPRGWQRSSMPQRSNERWSRTGKPAARRATTAPIAVVRPRPLWPAHRLRWRRRQFQRQFARLLPSPP